MRVDGPKTAIVGGVRTPFAKSGGSLRRLSGLELARQCVAELLARTGLRPRRVDRLIYGRVVPSLSSFNVARDIVLGTPLDPRTDADSVSQACISSYRALTTAADAISLGMIDVAIVGGVDSISDAPLGVSPGLAEALKRAAAAKTTRERIAAFSDVRPGDLLPERPAVAEPTTGETMGQGAERMAKRNGISREEQDRFAHRSHENADRAWKAGDFEEVMTLHLPDGSVIHRDPTVREDSSLESLSRLPPVFDPRHGTVTAGNSSPLTDGASALLVMNEERARAEGLPVLGTLVAYEYGGVDPTDQLLIGPAFVGPRALAKTKMELHDLELVDLHEAFAAQVASVLRAWDSDTFARERLGRERAVGRVDDDRLNVSGGSIALGHPFAATGARQVMQTLADLRRRGGGRALCSACAAGGLAAAVVLEAAP